MSGQDPLLYTPEEVAVKAAVGRHRVFDWIASGELESIKIGRSRRIPADALEDLIKRLREQARQVTAGGGGPA